MSPPLYLIAPLFAFSLTISFLSLTICQLPRLEWTTTGGTSQVWTWIRNLFLLSYNWTDIKRGNIIVMGQFKHKEYVAWWRSSGSPLSIAGIGKSGQIVRGDIWTRKSIPQPADPTTTQTLNPNLWIQQQQWLLSFLQNICCDLFEIWEGFW